MDFDVAIPWVRNLVLEKVRAMECRVAALASGAEFNASGGHLAMHWWIHPCTAKRSMRN
jgi:hypothetical protein